MLLSRLLTGLFVLNLSIAAVAADHVHPAPVVKPEPSPAVQAQDTPVPAAGGMACGDKPRGGPLTTGQPRQGGCCCCGSGKRMCGDGAHEGHGTPP